MQRQRWFLNVQHDIKSVVFELFLSNKLKIIARNCTLFMLISFMHVSNFSDIFMNYYAN